MRRAFAPASLPILSILFSLAGCGSTAPSLAPFAELRAVDPPAVFVERPGAAPPGIVELGPACPAEVGMVPTPFFRDRLLGSAPTRSRG